MSKLPYYRKPTYLSPSSLLALERDPLAFYLHRCGPQEHAPPKEETQLAMVVGSVFDAYVKNELASVLGCPCPSVGQLLGDIEAQDLLSEASKVAMPLVKLYKDSGAMTALLKEGVREVHLNPERMVVPGTSRMLMGRELGGVPIFGYPDALIIRPDGKRVVLDWKTTSKPSPDQGWWRKFDPADPMARYAPPHNKAGEPFHTLHGEWAVQLATYSWLLRPGVGHGASFAPVDVAIDQVVYGSADARVYQFRGTLTSQFQDDLRTRYQAAWDKIQDEALVDDETAEQLSQVPPELRGLM